MCNNTMHLFDMTCVLWIKWKYFIKLLAQDEWCVCYAYNASQMITFPAYSLNMARKNLILTVMYWTKTCDTWDMMNIDSLSTVLPAIKQKTLSQAVMWVVRQNNVPVQWITVIYQQYPNPSTNPHLEGEERIHMLKPSISPHRGYFSDQMLSLKRKVWLVISTALVSIS